MNTSKVAVIIKTNHSIAIESILFFCKEGYRVVCWEDTEQAEAAWVESSLQVFQSQWSKDVFSFQEITAFQEAVVRVIQAYGRIDVLINNPKLLPVSRAGALTNDIWHQTIDANLTVYLHAISVIAPFMQQQNFGRIINCALPLRIHDTLTDRHYDGIREGIKGITQLWARELGQYQITVNTIIPGYIEEDNTPLAEEKELQYFTYKIPMKRLAKANDVLQVYRFLCSDGANYITGTEIVVDGGVRI
ncbi:MAG: SDR family oxidoreductase [Cytophagaceae bacterium]|jgi:3-oxoacyl-[acyl-carrier protein] reductase|nr:SDR family oxidoreductase [Cytophagaceae bacterium]